VVSDYTKAVDNTIETLILYLHGEQHIRTDSDAGLWVVLAMVVRLAMRCGYHRDPKYYQGISPFRGEMRRRVWSFIRTADILFSFQLALPNMIRSGDCDTELPRNIFDDEFGPDSKELPLARSKAEPTPLSYMLAKTELALVFGEIIEEINSLSGHKAPYDEIMRKDARLQEVRNNIASHLKLRPLEKCAHDPAPLLVSRFAVDILYQKALCVLHRKYLCRARQNPRYAHSRRICVEASMEILRHQATIHRETQIGGRLRTMRFFIGSLTKNDILLGAMIVCLDLHYDSMPEQYDRFFWTAEQQSSMFQALEKSAEIWKESADTSVEAYKASSILGVMLEKLKCQGFGQSATTPEPRTTNEAFSSFDDNLQPEHSAAMTLGMLSSGGLTPNTAALFNSSMPLTPGTANKYNSMDIGMSDATAGMGIIPNFGIGGNSLGTIEGAPSPFTQVFGNLGAGPGITDLPPNLDWVRRFCV
jgi:Fungal specific transcription factor domain